MSTKNTTHDFMKVSQALGVDPVDASKRILEQERLGRPAPRWMRRIAKAINRSTRAA